jgi:hypothetical protein
MELSVRQAPVVAEVSQISMRVRWSPKATITVGRLESAHYDCFPSGPTELAILAWWRSRQLSSASPTST